MQSETRLHPVSVLFLIGSHIRQFVVPAIVTFFGVRSRNSEELFLLVLLLPATIMSLIQYATFRLRYDAGEMVLRSGLLFRNERHIPYGRIQNLDASQNLLHRALGVVEVRVQTGSGTEAEATLKVLPVSELEEMRRRVFEKRAASQIEGAEVATLPDQREPDTKTLLYLPPRELLLHGFIENRGMVVILAAVGLVWELGSLDKVLETVVGEEVEGGGVLRDFFSSLGGAGGIQVERVLLFAAVLLMLALLIRTLSMFWALTRLHGFKVTRVGDDLRTEYGLFTRVRTSIPIRRIQSVTVSSGLLHRAAGRVAVRVSTAGIKIGESGTSEREQLAPIIRIADLLRLVREIEPGVDLAALEWQSVHPRAFGRVLRRTLAWSLVLSVPVFIFASTAWGAAVLALLTLRAAVRSRTYVAHLGWALTSDLVSFKRGWIWRRMDLARLNKIQVVANTESPFDRRTGMAALQVDTAGSALGIPYLARDTAARLREELAARAAVTAFRW